LVAFCPLKLFLEVLPMKIAQVADCLLPVPPKKYGGMERMVSYLTEELVLQGHDVTLFASPDSKTRAQLISPPTNSQRELPYSLLDQIVKMSQLSKHSSEFDLIHLHAVSPVYWLPFLRLLNVPYLITQHNILLDVSVMELYFREFSDVPLVSISNAQREPALWLNWQATVYCSLPLELYESQEKSEGYLAFIGRFSPAKGLHDAIEIAKQSKMKLKIAGCPFHASEQKYFESAIQPLLGDPMLEYVGELDDNEKQSFLGGACALLFPVTWREPFGLVMVEALACGTPVIAYRNGAVQEVITDGITGFVVKGLQDAIDAVSRIQSLSRSRCRQEVEERFSVGRMCKEYLDQYEKLIAGWKYAVK
jgi:glycosyltransferase involved in cell wall biosynthesis